MESARLPTSAELIDQCNDREQLNQTVLTILQSNFSEDDILALFRNSLNQLFKRNSTSSEENDGSLTNMVVAMTDAIWLLSSLHQDDSPSSLLVACTQLLAESSATARPYLMQSLDSSLLDPVLKHANINTESFLKKIRLFNTASYYKQQKYNLLAEESEGYAKFLALITCNKKKNRVDESRDMMATFHLDPNRCVDLVLHILTLTFDEDDEEQQQQGLLMLLQDASPTDKMAPLLNFQLQDSSRRPAVLKCMAWLTRQQQTENNNDILSMEQMWSYLWGPEQDKALDELYDQKYQQDLEEIKTLGRVSLSGGGSSGKPHSAAIDLASLAGELAIQWLPHVFDHDHCWSLLDNDQWSKLFTLFPQSLGIPACAALRNQDWFTEASKRILPPWNPDYLSRNDTSVPTVDDVLKHVMKPLLLMSESGCIQYDPILYSQICRVLTLCLRENKTEYDSNRLDQFLRTFLLPSLCLFPANPAISNDVWSVFQEIPFRRRYDLYTTWRGKGLEKAALQDHKSKPLWLIRGELEAGKLARYSLKRLSKDTIRDISRSIAQVCFSQPLVVFTTILNQIESYDNLVGVMVDALHFVSPLSLDVLGFCILSRLSGNSGGEMDVNRSRLKEDGVNVSQWLQSLESFTGEFYKRFPGVECRGIFGYLMQRLNEGHVMELGVLRTLLKTSGGWSFADYAPAASLSMTQIEGRAGSTLLKRETMSFGVHVNGSFNVRSSQQVRTILQEQDMGVVLLILLAQVTMAILLDFLTNPSDDKDAAITQYAQSLPSFVELHTHYQLDIETAWMLCRPLVQAAERVELGRKSEILKDTIKRFVSSEDSRRSYEEVLPQETLSHMSVTLFETFYAHSLYDLFCPEDVYASEISRLDKEVERLSNSKSPVSNDATELERLKNTSADLTEEMVAQSNHVESIRNEISRRKDGFFPAVGVSKESMSTFFTRCIYPRCMQGPDDAMYCARFIQLLHEMDTPGFITLYFFDCAMITFSRSLYSLTEGEAANVSIFLRETWKLLSHWRYAEHAYANEVEGKPGTYIAANDPIFSLDRQRDDEMEVESGVENDSQRRKVTTEFYERLYNKWHAAIGATSIGALQSKEYMHKRCCLIVLSRMIEVYPTRPKTGIKLLTALEPLQSENNTLADIRAAAQAYSMQLVKARDDGVWKEEDAATVQARQEKEQANAAARQKKSEKQMEEMKRESEKISEELGEWRGRPGDRRPDNHRLDDRKSRGPPPPPATQQQSGRKDGRYVGSGNYSSMGRRDNTGIPQRGTDVRRQRPTTEVDSGRNSNTTISGAKRSRPSSPSDQDNNKRARSQLEPGEEAPPRNDDARRRGTGSRPRGKERR